MIPKVMETSDRQADNKTEREQVWEGGSVGALVKQDAAVLAWLFTLEKINMAAAHVFLDALFYAALWSSTLTGNSLRVKMEFPLHHCGFGILMMMVAAWRTNCFTDRFFSPLRLLSYSSITLQYTATEQIWLQCCVSLCGCKYFFLEWKAEKRDREREEEEVQFTATLLRMCKNKLYCNDAVFHPG